MSKNEVIDLRQRIDAERTRLDEHLTTLEGELLSGVPLLVAGVVVAAVLLVRRGRKRSSRTLAMTLKLM